MKRFRRYLIGLLVFTMILAQSPAVLATGLADSKGAELSAEELDRAIGDYIEERAEGTAALSLGVYVRTVFDTMLISGSCSIAVWQRGRNRLI